MGRYYEEGETNMDLAKRKKRKFTQELVHKSYFFTSQAKH